MHLVRQTKVARKWLKIQGECRMVDGRIAPWMVDFGHQRS
jgi:hypothetical protein